MRRLDNRSLRFHADEIYAFARLRDEAARLPWFLEYYRKADVDRFFVVDNGSTDGSTDYLLSQPDVHLYYTEESYADSRGGLQWMNELLERFAIGHWTLTVDIDELLVYPGCETFSLRPFTDYLDSSGADALRTMILDMYSDRAVRATSYVPGGSFLEVCPFFDVDSYTYSGTSEVAVRGGPRERVFWRYHDWGHPAPFLSKVPLVKWREDRLYEVSTHLISDVKPAGVTGALLHFKFFSDFPTRAAVEVERKEHFAGARQYVTYFEVLRENPDLTLFHAGSLRYRDSFHLVEVGLLRAPETYLQLLEREGDRTRVTLPFDRSGCDRSV